jgi:hypothetical protein
VSAESLHRGSLLRDQDARWTEWRVEPREAGDAMATMLRYRGRGERVIFYYLVLSVPCRAVTGHADAALPAMCRPCKLFLSPLVCLSLHTIPIHSTPLHSTPPSISPPTSPTPRVSPLPEAPLVLQGTRPLPTTRLVEPARPRPNPSCSSPRAMPYSARYTILHYHAIPTPHPQSPCPVSSNKIPLGRFRA